MHQCAPTGSSSAAQHQQCAQPVASAPYARQLCSKQPRPRRLWHREATRQGAAPLISHTTWLSRGGADGPDSPFHVLRLAEDGLNNVGGAVKRRRFSGIHRTDAPAVDWGAVYQDPTLPLLVDAGCGAGRSVLLAAYHGAVPSAAALTQHGCDTCAWAHQPGNFLGVDQHTALISRANLWAKRRDLSSRCHFVDASARAETLQPLLATYPGPIAIIAVQYPDPHFRAARFFVDQPFINMCTGLLTRGAAVYLASDVRSTAALMRDTFATHGPDSFALHPVHSVPGMIVPDSGIEVNPYLPDSETQTYLRDSDITSHWQEGGWLADSALGDLPTERELYARQVTKCPVFRVLLTRL